VRQYQDIKQILVRNETFFGNKELTSKNVHLMRFEKEAMKLVTPRSKLCIVAVLQHDYKVTNT